MRMPRWRGSRRSTRAPNRATIPHLQYFEDKGSVPQCFSMDCRRMFCRRDHAQGGGHGPCAGLGGGCQSPHTPLRQNACTGLQIMHSQRCARCCGRERRPWIFRGGAASAQRRWPPTPLISNTYCRRCNGWVMGGDGTGSRVCAPPGHTMCSRQDGRRSGHALPASVPGANSMVGEPDAAAGLARVHGMRIGAWGGWMPTGCRWAAT